MKKLLLALVGCFLTFSVQAQIFGNTDPYNCGNDSVFQPCYNWALNPTTGMYQPVTGQVAIAINGVQVGYWASDGYHGAITLVGIVGVANGGTGSNLSATGGASQVLKQTSVGGNVTVARLACADLSNAAASCSTDTTVATNISTGLLPLARGGTNADLSATGGASQFLKQNSVGAAVTVARPACADLSNGSASCSTDATNASNITTGNLPAAQLPATVADDKVLVGDSASAATWRALVTGAVKYTTGTNTFAQAACADLSNGTASCSTDTTNATNISTGTLASARGGAGAITGALKGNGAGVVSQAACADLSNGTASCSTDTTNATNISSGTLGAARLPGTVADDAVLVGDSASAATWRAVPNCTDTTGNHLNYTTSTNTFSCGTTVPASVTLTIASGTSALGTGAITSATCATVVTTSATNTATTDAISWSFNADPSGVTGYAPSTSGTLFIYAYPTVNNVNFKVCNNTSASVTPGAITLNWRVVR